MGSDGAEEAHAGGSSDFNPRSPCGERLFDSVGSMESVKFQSTLPVWGATLTLLLLALMLLAFQSTLPVWGATLRWDPPLLIPGISIHAPRVGSDDERIAREPWHCISIHAPRVGSDRDWRRIRRIHVYFNPRSPCGERRCLPFIYGSVF